MKKYIIIINKIKCIRDGACFLMMVFILVFFTTCKKIEKFPDNLFGEWISFSGCRTHIIINKNGKGEYGTFLQQGGCPGDRGANGKVRFNKTHLYIGLTKFKFIEEPIRLNGKDSIEDCLPSILKAQTTNCKSKHPILAKMTLKNSILHNRDTITYFKIIDY